MTPLLPFQSFSGGIQTRTLSSGVHLDAIISDLAAEFVVVSSGRKVVTSSDHCSIRWWSLESLQKELGLQYVGDGVFQTNDSALQVQTYLLGVSQHDIEHKTSVSLALDISSLLSDENWLITHPEITEKVVNLRTALTHLPPGKDLALAGHAVALSQWHQSHKFCPQCGSPTVPVASGARRQCTSQQHQLYPRTDPVIIALIESPDGQRALLGRSKNLPRGMLTCLSGFVDQAESIEEAVAREVKEEAGVDIDVTDVSIIGSQPWPIGRGMSCELMIGCMGRAKSEELNVDYEEMDEVRWVDRQSLKRALDVAKVHYGKSGGRSSSPLRDQAIDSNVFNVPPPFAIAHHLLALWVDNKNERPVKSSL